MNDKLNKKVKRKIDINPLNLYYNYDDNELYNSIKQSIKDDKYNFQSLIHIDEGNLSPKKYIVPLPKPKPIELPKQIYINNYKNFNVDMKPFYSSNIKPLTYYDIYPEENKINLNKIKCSEYNYLKRPDYTKYTTKYDQEFNNIKNKNNSNIFSHNKLNNDEYFQMEDLKLKRLNEKREIYSQAFQFNKFEKKPYKKCTFIEL
jgi:hypothetical protein